MSVITNIMLKNDNDNDNDYYGDDNADNDQ